MPTIPGKTIAQAKDTFGLLNTVAVLQPISIEDLKEFFADATPIIKFLERAKLIRKLRNRMWVATARGLGIASTNEMGRKRDILRMFQLIERTRRR